MCIRDRSKEAVETLAKFTDSKEAQEQINTIKKSLGKDDESQKSSVTDLFHPSMKLVITIGIVVAALQQLTGINSVFFYAPMIFEQSGLGTDAAVFQAILVGLVNLVFTILAILFIDRLGRKPLLTFGVAGIVISMFVLSYGFSQATYSMSDEAYVELSSSAELKGLSPLIDQTFEEEDELEQSAIGLVGKEVYESHKSSILNSSIHMNTMLILVAILSFVASFAISIGPVMWVLFSELFPNKIRGLAISFVGLINSAVSFIVQWVFPWELDVLGSSATFLIYGVCALFGLIFIVKVIPETKGKSLEELEAQLVN